MWQIRTIYNSNKTTSELWILWHFFCHMAHLTFAIPIHSYVKIVMVAEKSQTLGELEHVYLGRLVLWGRAGVTIQWSNEHK